MKITLRGSEFTDDELVDLLVDDKIGRSGQVPAFLRLLQDGDGSRTFWLDECWGNGKTTFCRQVCLVLDALRGDAEDASKLNDWLAQQDSTILGLSYLPVYYNAWEHQDWDDPVPGIVLSIAEAAGEDFDSSDSIADGAVIRAALGSVLAALPKRVLHSLPVDLSPVLESLSTDDPWHAYRAHRELGARVNAFIDSALVERANRLLLVVDELDRCDPKHALGLLEKLENLFGSDQVTILVAVNSAQLAEALRGVYGPGFDAYGFLERFYDERFGLASAADVRFDDLVWKGNPTEWATKAVRDAMQFYGMSLRQKTQYANVCMVAREKLASWPTWGNKVWASGFVVWVLQFYVLALKCARPVEFSRLLSGDLTVLDDAATGRPDWASAPMGVVLEYLSRERGESADGLAAKGVNEWVHTMLNLLLAAHRGDSSVHERARAIGGSALLPETIAFAEPLVFG